MTGVETLVPGVNVLEVVAVFVSAVAGGLAAVRKRFDLFGVLVLAWVCGLGGGILRDVLIGDTPPVGISSWKLVVAAIAAGLATFVLHPGLTRLRRSVIVLDAAALSLFVVQGTAKALDLEAGLLASLVVGVLTGIGGGVLRDMLVGEVPLIFADRQLYAVPAILGAATVVVLWETGWWQWWSALCVVALVFGFRLLSLALGWVVPHAGGGWTGRWGRESGRMDG